eukprot:s3260_g4.t1
MRLHAMEEELSQRVQKDADDMTNKAHTINVSQRRLRVMTEKFEKEKRQADEMAQKSLDLQGQLDVMTKKFDKEKRQADETTQKNLEVQEQLDVMTKKFDKEKKSRPKRAVGCHGTDC